MTPSRAGRTFRRMTPNLDMSLLQTRATFGARVGRPVVHAGVVALPTALAFTPANLAALEAAWRFEREAPAEESRR